MSQLEKVLKEYWGYSKFIQPQKKIITNVLEKNDTLVLLPTGGGKSITFQVPTLLTEGVCLVISPLIALMSDQIKNLQERNIKALALTSKLNENEIVIAFDNLKYGNYKFLYLSPEKLQSQFILEKLKQINLQLIAIDEAHCISEWGHDFRPSYLQIKILRDQYPTIPIIALTASATKLVQTDIIKNLELVKPRIFKKSFYRKNLAYQIIPSEDKLFKTEQVLKKIKGVKIIYTNTRRKTIELSQQLNSLGYLSTYYHGGLSHEEKLNAYNNWLTEKHPVMVATNAFGMGIDKPNVRVVIHYDLPKSIENYMQEAGRAGRDGIKAFSVVLKNNSDVHSLEETHRKSIASVDFIKKVYFQLNQYFHISLGELLEESYNFNLLEFCETYNFPTIQTYNALRILNNNSVLMFDENANQKSKVSFIVPNQVIVSYCKRHPSHNNLIKLLLRSYGGIYGNLKTINEFRLSKTLNTSVTKVISLLNKLQQDEIIIYKSANSNTQIRFLVPRDDNRTINSISKHIKQRNKVDTKKIHSLIQFIENNEVCRNRQLLTYFDEKEVYDCEICDVCISKKNNNSNNTTSILEAIIHLLNSKEELSSKEIVLNLNMDESDILFCLQSLLEKNIIHVTLHNKFRLSN